MPDPKLKTAAAEIEAILQRHDIAGIVMLQTPKHLEYIMAIAPSWSCCWIEDYGAAGKAMRVKAKREDFPSKAAHVEALGADFAAMTAVLVEAHDDVCEIRGLVMSHMSYDAIMCMVKDAEERLETALAKVKGDSL